VHNTWDYCVSGLYPLPGVKSNIMEQRDPKTIKTPNYNVYFKLILTYNAKTGALTKKNKSKIQQ
jgi:hypothetical protein